MTTFTASEIKAFVSQRQRGAVRPGGARLSVVLPSYNQAAFLPRTLNSIANQAYGNLELLVLDGGSRDGSVEVLEGYGDLFAYMVSQPDGGQAAAINDGFARATGDFLAWQNADDLYLPGFMHAVDEAIAQNPDADLIIANSYVIDADENIIWGTRYGPFDPDYLALVTWNLTSQSTFVSRRLAREVGPMPDWRIAFDYDWFLRIGRAARCVVEMKRYGGAYRIHPDSKFSTSVNDEREGLEKRTLAELGYKVRADKRLADHWPVRRALKRLQGKLHERMLYPRTRGLAPLSRVWAGALKACGHRLVGY